MLRALLIGGLLTFFFHHGVAADEPVQLIQFTVTIVSGAADKLPMELNVGELNKRIADLEKSGGLESMTRLQFSALEDQAVKFQFGETVPVLSGRQFAFGGSRGGGPGNAPGGGFPGGSTFTREQVGTAIGVVARTEGNAVVAGVTVEQSKLETKRSADEAAAEPASTSTVHFNSKVRIPRGQTVVVAGFHDRTGGQSRQTLMLVSAAVADAGR